MWSFGGEGDNMPNNKRGLKGVSTSSSSKSSSTSSSPSPFSPSSTLHRNPRPKTMEEVWKDINLASLHDHPSRDDPRATNFRGMIYQDFLARPFSKDPPPTVPLGYGSPAPPPPTVLSLNSVSEFHFIGNSDPLRPQPQPISNVCAFDVPFDVLAASSSLLGKANGKEMLPESDNNNTGDRRHKRMIKNRESAARSRARKQAYTNELELEVAHLMEENARLKKQQQLCVSSNAQLPKKHQLHRTSTAPF